MKAGEMLAQICSALPEDLAQAIANVTFEIRDQPTAIDFARGATTDHVAYFFGETRERPDEDISIPDTSSPRGVIVLFVDKIKPLTPRRFTEVVCHEILHVLGFEEHEIVHDFGYAP